jgi:hypothetical protein
MQGTRALFLANLIFGMHNRSVQRRLFGGNPLEHLSLGARAGQDSFMDFCLNYPAQLTDMLERRLELGSALGLDVPRNKVDASINLPLASF